MLSLKPLSRRGDTIIEVMVVLAVLGLALSMAYTTANRSLKNTRQAQENAEASVLAQSQIEALRSMTVAGNPQNIFQAGPYCVNTSTTPYVVVAPPSNACMANPLYDVKIEYQQLSAIPKGGTFKVTITWADVSGQGNDTVTSVYRLYQQ